VGLGAVAALGAGLAWWTARASTVPERREGAATGEASAPPERREAAFEQRRLTFLGLPSRGVIAPDGGSVLFATRDATGWTAWRQRGEEAPTELARLQKLWALALSPSGVALMVGERRADGPPVQLTVAADGAVTERETKAFFEAAWSPDGETLAGIEGSTRKDVALVARGSTADEGARRRVALDGDVQWLVDVGWAPSSDRVLVSVRTAQGARRLLAVPKDGGATVPLLPAEQTFTDFATSEDALFMLRPARGATELVRFAWGPGSAAPDERAEVLLSGLDASDLSVSRDGRKITFTKREASSNVWLVDTARGLRGKVELTRGAREHRAPAFSPDGEALAMVRRAKDVELVVMPSSGGPEHRVSAPGHVVSSLAWAPDGRSLAYATVPSGEGDEPRIFVGDREGGAPRAVTLDVAPSAGSDALGWAPGPLLWAQTSNNRNLVASDGERQREAPLFDAPVGWSFSPAPNARGDVAVFRNRGTKEEPFGVWIVGADGAPPRRVAEGRHFPLRFAPDGETLYVMTVGGAGDEPTALARIPRGGTPETVLTLDVAPDVVVGADITPDGARAALSVEKRSFDLWIAERP
jgi:dipeptidyl aminopeptidase/acylaminoacyl peptidase